MSVSNKSLRSSGLITAVLGPTNTGKTFYAIEQMVGYDRGVIGFPLRLLARENYDRLVRMKGKESVALVTGEEKIIPPYARYFSCTVESMPMEQPAGQEFDFVAVDEIQLCADPDRGHVFTDRLLRARGTKHTMFLGSDTIRPLIAELVPDVQFEQRPRLSQLTYTGFKKITRMAPRSAIVAFTIEDVYAIAELIRRQRGGTAVVLGALSPRTRNKQVEMYQNGEVDFLVATDAIGMGLNMDIHHVALASTRKFDGEAMRSLSTAEIAQVAGRAGRHLRDGTFGVTGNLTGLDDDIVEAIEHHRFEPLSALCWRNSLLSFDTPQILMESLDRFSGTSLLTKGRPSDDYMSLLHLMRRDDVMARASGSVAVRMLWDVCQIPDFRQTLTENHQDLVAGIYVSLMDKGSIDADFTRVQLERLDHTDGDVDTLTARIAHIRTWTYITHKSEWLRNAPEWQAKARAIEDRLSDALHEALTKRFVDRRSAVLMRAIDEGADLLAGIRSGGEVVVEGHAVGRLEGFKFIPDENAGGTDYKTVMTAARNALKPEIKRRLGLMLNAEDKQFKLNDAGEILFQADASNPLPGLAVARVIKGPALLQPEIVVEDSPLLEGQDKAAITEHLRGWVKRHIAVVLESLIPLNDETGIDGTARGIAFQLHEAMGILPRSTIEDLIGGLDDAGRAALRSRKVRLGPILIFIPALNKPAGIRLRALLWSLWHGRDLPAQLPPDGMTSISIEGKTVDPDYYRVVGYPVYGPRAIRVDMLDRLICAVYDGARDGKFQADHKMAEWLGCKIPELYAILEAMGHRKIHDPAEEKAAEAVKVEETKAEEIKVEEPKVEEAVVAAPAVPAKPALATFQLRRGKAYGPTHEKRERTPKPEKKEFSGKPREPREKKPFRKDKKKESRDDRQERIISARPTTSAESPFAMLAALKSKK